MGDEWDKKHMGYGHPTVFFHIFPSSQVGYEF